MIVTLPNSAHLAHTRLKFKKIFASGGLLNLLNCPTLSYNSFSLSPAIRQKMSLNVLKCPTIRLFKCCRHHVVIILTHLMWLIANFLFLIGLNRSPCLARGSYMSRFVSGHCFCIFAKRQTMQKIFRRIPRYLLLLGTWGFF